MSRTETHFGKIRKVIQQEGETFIDLCLRLWRDEGYDEWEFDEPSDLFEDGDKYLWVGEEVWEIIEDKEVGSEGDAFCNLTPNEDGTYSFSSQFHNGGTWINEMLEEAIEELNKTK